jgi:phospholipase C
MWDEIVDESLFRSIRRLPKDIQLESNHTFPEVIFCEPSYVDSPARLGFQPNDDHPPLPVGPGQAFLRDVYEAVTSNPARWAKTVMIVTYDEHGGFFDHVPPLPIPTEPPPGVKYDRFETTGVRVPAFVVSPLVEPASVYKQNLDHTSILQFLAEMFGDGDYSPDVRRRQDARIGSVSDVLTRTQPLPVAKMPAPEQLSVAVVAIPAASKDKTANQQAFEKAAQELLVQRPAQALAAYPELAQLNARHE